MISGVSLNEKHCRDDLGMILTAFEIGLPEVQTNYIEIPGMDGFLDLTTALTGEVRYNSRTLSLTFETAQKISERNWASFLSYIAGLFHGQEVRIVFDDDPDFYYMGRCAVDSFATSFAKQTIVLTCTCDPYKYNVEGAGAQWLWDLFSFTDGVILGADPVTVSGTLTASFENYRKRVTPTFICSSAMTLTWNGQEYALSAGENTIYDISFAPGEEETLTFKGNGTLTFVCEGGAL